MGDNSSREPEEQSTKDKPAQQKTFTSRWGYGLDPYCPGGDLGPGLCEPGEPGYTRSRE